MKKIFSKYYIKSSSHKRKYLIHSNVRKKERKERRKKGKEGEREEVRKEGSKRGFPPW